MISLWNTHGYRTYLFGSSRQSFKLSDSRVATVSLLVFGFFRPRPPSDPERPETNLNILRLPLVFKQRALFTYGGRYGILAVVLTLEQS